MRAIAAFVAFVLFAASAIAGTVEIRDGRFFRNGQPWLAEGVTLVGFVAPENLLRPAYANARKKWGPQLLTNIKAFGADTIRFQVSQAALDPESKLFDKRYEGEVLEAVALARKSGFVVIVSMQWQPPAGSLDQKRMPSAVTERAWKQIARQFRGDSEILLEVFNEPGLKEDTAANWKIWQQTMQPLVEVIRSETDNILLLDGLRGGKYLTDVPPVSDPLGRLAYAIHPFLMKFNRTPAQWEKNWGAFARGKPVIATAFAASSDRKAQCFDKVPETTEQLFQYLRSLNIGLVVWAFDLASIQRRGELTNFENFSCGGDERKGVGQAASDYFRAHD